MDPVGRLQALEGRGLSQVELGQNESALASFEQAALLGVGFELPALAKQNFEHMRKICLKCDLPKKLAEVDAVLRGSEA
jgi:hypothetical protein